MLNRVDISFCLSGNGRDPDPYQHGASNMISLYSGLVTLALLHVRDLLEFAVKLLDLPAKGTRLLRSLHGILSKIVCDDLIRAAG